MGRPQQLLWERYWQTRDHRYRNELVLEYEPLVRKVGARFYRPGGELPEDLLQVGRLGLISAIERYDPQLGAAFSTFAVPTIRGSIAHYLRDHCWPLKPPRRLRYLRRQLDQLGATVEAAVGRPPTAAELAAAAGVDEERVLAAMELDYLYSPLSLEVGADTAGGGPLIAADSGTPGVGSLTLIEWRIALRAALGTLTPRQRLLIQLRFRDELPQAAVAEHLGISQMHVSRLERQAIRLLRGTFER